MLCVFQVASILSNMANCIVKCCLFTSWCLLERTQCIVWYDDVGATSKPHLIWYVNVPIRCGGDSIPILSPFRRSKGTSMTSIATIEFPKQQETESVVEYSILAARYLTWRCNYPPSLSLSLSVAAASVTNCQIMLRIAPPTLMLPIQKFRSKILYESNSIKFCGT